MTRGEDVYYCEATDQLYLLREFRAGEYIVYCNGDMMFMSQSQVDRNMIFIGKLRGEG